MPDPGGLDPSGRSEEVAAMWLPGTKSAPRARLPPVRLPGMGVGAICFPASMVPLHMLSAVRTESAALKQQLVEKDKQLEEGRQAVADSDWRRRDAEMRCEDAESRAQALQSKLDELLKEGSMRPAAVPEPEPSSHGAASVPIPQSAPQPAPPPLVTEAGPAASLQALRRMSRQTSRRLLLEKAKSIIEEARARALEEAKLVGENEVEHWRPKAWVSSLHEVPDGLAKVIMAPLVEHLDFGDDDDSDKARRTQLAFLRNLGEKCKDLSEGQKGDVMLELLNSRHGDLLSRLANVLTRGICDLAAASAATGAELHAKFVSESMPDLSYGKLNFFFEGLEGLIGSPNPNLLDAMAHEHCAGPDAKFMFTTFNYSISTYSPLEWYFVYDPDKGKAEALPHGKDWPSEQYPSAVVPRGEIRRFRKALSLASFDVVLREKNQKLESFGAKKLQTVEFVASRLYTGPMFMKYNTALRMCGKDKRFVDFFKELNHGNMYTTTLHVINSAIVKLGKITAQSKVYRGISGRTLPKDFMDPKRTEPKGGIELGFMSTTHDKSVAVHYAQKKGVVFEIQMGMIDRGADLSWLSQYPHEAELLFSPLTGCEIVELEVEGSLLVAKVRLSVNLTTPTIEQVIAKMQSANIQLLDNIRANVLQANPPPRVLLAIDGLRGTQAARDPAFFNEASNFRAATEIALSEQKEAFAVLADEELWAEVAMEMDAGPEEAFEALSVRMWNAALVSARSGQHTAAIKLLRQSMRRALHEERASPLKGVRPDEIGDDRPSTGEGLPKVTRSMLRKQSMMTKIEEKIGAVGGQGLAQEDFVSMARELLPSLPERQAQHIFKECDKDNSGMIGSAEAQEVLERLLDVDTGSDAGTLAKGSKPLFSTRAALARSKPRRLSLEDRIDLEPPTSVREREICEAVKVATEAVSSEKQREDIQLVAQLLKLGVPQPWPATLCHLVDDIDGGPNAAVGSEPAVGTELVRRIVAAFREDRMAVGEEVLVLQNGACNLWKKATIEAHSPAPDGEPGCFYDVTFALGQAKPIKGMSANNVLPVEEGGAGALLRAAAIAGDNGLVQALLKAGVHVYEASPDGNTALHGAAGNGHAAVYKTLMDAAGNFPAKKGGPPAHAFTKNIRGMRAFDYMVQGHHIRCTRLLRPSAQDKDYISASKEMDKLPQLLFAACKGDAEQLARVVAQVSERGEGVDDVKTSGGMTALMLACRKGPSSKNCGEGVEEKVRTLLDNSADVNAKSTAGCVALAFAAEAGNPGVVSMLLQKDAEVEALSPDGMTPLLLACQNGWTQVAEILLDAGASTNRRQEGGDEFPPIIYAAMNGHTACVDMLIQRKAEVNYAKSDGFNALILAAGFNQLEVVRRLVRNGARVEDANAKGHTALLYASNTGQGPVVRALLQLGANPLHLDKEGHSALHLASKGGHSDVVSALLQGLKSQREFDINLTTPAGDSALHLACVNGNEKVVGLLVNYNKEKGENMGADQRMRDRNGRDAYAIAKEGGHAPVCVLLQPTREQMINTFTKLSTADAFKRARDSLTVENIKALKRELVGVGVIDKDVLSTRPAGCDAVPSFFTRLSCATVDESQPELFEENKAMWQENELKGRRGQQFLLATWKPSLARVEPSADRESFEGGAAAAEVVPAAPKLSEKLGKLGCVPLPERHRFLLLNDDLSWHKFNVLVLGKSGAPNELNEAVKLIEDMKAEALAFAARSGWSKSIGLYFEPYPHASADALYLHIMDEVDPETGERVGPPEQLREQLLTMEDVLGVIKTEHEEEGAAWVDQTLKEDWSVRIVCVSPKASNRGNLTLACMREAYSKYPAVVNSLLVQYDDRDQDRDAYAPAFHFRDIPRPAKPCTDWDEESYDYVLAIGGMSNQQGSSLRQTLQHCECPFAANGTPGFNVGFGLAATALTKFLQDEMRPPGIVDDASAALIVGIEEHLTYISLLPRSAQLAAKQSRVAFPLTARGHTREGAGSYGRQFRDKDDEPTIRNREWFIDLAGKYAKELFKSNQQAAETLDGVTEALRDAELEAMIEKGDVIGDPNELGAILKVCDQFCKPEVIAAMHSSAERLFPILVECDETVGVVQSKIYDAKLVLSFAAKRAIDAGCTITDGTLATYATFGLAEPERPGGKSMVANRELVRDLVFVLMSLHRQAGDGLYVPPDEGLRAQVDLAIAVLAQLPVLKEGLMICDTGVDPNEDDLTAIMMVCNLNMLSERKLSVSGVATLAKEEVEPPVDEENVDTEALWTEFHAMDSNGDNKVTGTEFMNARLRAERAA